MGCAVTYFLNVGAYVGSGAVTTTNLKKGNKKKKKEKFLYCFLKVNTVECPEFFYVFLPILRANEKHSA